MRDAESLEPPSTSKLDTPRLPNLDNTLCKFSFPSDSSIVNISAPAVSHASQFSL